MSWLADLLGKTIKTAASILPDRKVLRFLGAGVTVADNVDEGSTDVTVGLGEFVIGEGGFSTWAAAYAAASQSGMPVTLRLTENTTIPAGAYDIDGWTIIGSYPEDESGGRVELRPDVGVTLTGRNVTFVHIELSQHADATGPLWSLESGSNAIHLIDSVIQSDSVSEPAIESPEGSFLFLFVRGSSLSGLGPRAVQYPSGDAGFTYVYLFGQSVVSDNAFVGNAGGATVFVSSPFAQTVPASQTLFVGGTYVNQVMAASSVAVSMGGRQINALGQPATQTDAANKGYVDDNLGNPFPYGFPSYGTIKRITWDRTFARPENDGFFTNASQNGGGSLNELPALAGSAVGGLDLGTGTDPAGGGLVRTGTAWLFLGSNRVRTRTDLYIPTLSDGTQTFIVRSGLADSGFGTVIDGVYFLHDHTKNSGRWTCVCAQNVGGGGVTETDSGVAVSTSLPQALEIEVNAAGSQVRFWIDGVLVATTTTNIPTTVSRALGVLPVLILKSAGSTTRSVRVIRSAGEVFLTTPI